MRILFITCRVPYPPLRGDQVRCFHFLRILSKRHHVTLVTPVVAPINERIRQIVHQLCGCWLPIYKHSSQIITSLIRYPYSSLPLQVLYFYLPAFKKQIQNLLQKETFDVVHVQLARMAPIVEELYNIPKVLDFVDALSLNMRYRGLQTRGPLKWFFYLEAQRMAHYERHLTSLFDQLIVSSPFDQKIIGSCKTLHVVPNGVDTKEFPYIENERKDNLIIFTGRIGYFFNTQAAVYFATKVFPIVLQEVPSARFLIVGADPPRAVQRLANLSNIEVIGYVPRIHSYLSKATIAVAPVQIGTGIQNKVLEAMASGTPVVATSHVLKSIEAKNGEHLLVADDPYQMAYQVIRLLRDSALRYYLARNARQLVEKKYSWERAAAMLDRIYHLARAGKKHTQGDNSI